jgi:hypothetical protein
VTSDSSSAFNADGRTCPNIFLCVTKTRESSLSTTLHSLPNSIPGGVQDGLISDVSNVIVSIGRNDRMATRSSNTQSLSTFALNIGSVATYLKEKLLRTDNMASGVSVQLMSDLHLEMNQQYDIYMITPRAPMLALLGDIGRTCDKGLFDFIKAQLEQFKVVFYVLGNHEPYQSNWDSAKTLMTEFKREIDQLRASNHRLGEFVFLDQTRYDISEEVTVLGCTLFSRVGPTEEDRNRVGRLLNDFKLIENWTVEQHNASHEADLTWLNAQVEEIATKEPTRKIIILTHYCPTTDRRTIDPKLPTAGLNLSSGFSTDLSKQPCWKEGCVKAWAFGHTHYNCAFRPNRASMRVVTNQRGYSFAVSAGFDESRTISV